MSSAQKILTNASHSHKDKAQSAKNAQLMISFIFLISLFVWPEWPLFAYKLSPTLCLVCVFVPIISILGLGYEAKRFTAKAEGAQKFD